MSVPLDAMGGMSIPPSELSINILQSSGSTALSQRSRLVLTLAKHILDYRPSRLITWDRNASKRHKRASTISDDNLVSLKRTHSLGSLEVRPNLFTVRACQVGFKPKSLRPEGPARSGTGHKKMYIALRLPPYNFENMFFPTRSVVLLSLALIQACFAQLVDQIQRRNAQKCCERLGVLLPGKVHLPDSPEYISQESTYYSGEQVNLHPACRVSPSSTADVSIIIELVNRRKCRFAVRSGGHMNWKGSSNIDESGLTIDTGSLTEISLAEDGKSVTVGPGLRWGAVYHALEPHNLTVAGGRASGVGVGGFLMGGGISFYSLQYGFGSDNVVSYEVVLSNGTATHVSAATYPDLFWALKGGSTNFGLVTKFELATFEVGQIWGGSLFFDIGQGRSLLDYLVRYTEKLADDPTGLSSLMFASSAEDYIIWSPNAYLAPTPYPPLMSELQSFTPFLNTMRVASVADITDEIQAMSPDGSRTNWFSLTVKADAQLVWDMFQKGQEIYEPVLNRPGASWALIAQPINRAMMAAAARNGGNPFGLSSSDGDQFLVVVLVFWTDPQDDATMYAKRQEHLDWSTAAARGRGLLNRFIYLNYAYGSQPVLNGFGHANLVKLRNIQRKYGAAPLIDTWKGGFKL